MLNIFFFSFCLPEESLVEIKHKDSQTTHWKDLSTLAFGDDPDLWWKSKTDVDICSQPLPEAAVTCKHKRRRRRWYYSPMTGHCIRFLGCETPGNNFEKKTFCKSKCRTNVLSKAQRKALQNNSEVCYDSPPESAKKCTVKKRRWFYNARTGKCEKFMGCGSRGNIFSRRLFCKITCKRRRIEFRLRNKAGNCRVIKNGV